MVTPSDIEAKVANAVFGNSLIVNVFRAYVVEAIIDEALSPNWTWCSSDWAGWDFENGQGVRLEVKQSAAKQTWSSPKPSRPYFDIRTRKGHYKGADWIGKPGRNADIYIFAWHPVVDATADHRDPEQWEFFIVPTDDLPGSKSVGISKLRTLTSAVRFHELEGAVNSVLTDLNSNLD